MGPTQGVRGEGALKHETPIPYEYGGIDKGVREVKIKMHINLFGLEPCQKSLRTLGATILILIYI